jgi:hypothetical protein
VFRRRPRPLPCIALALALLLAQVGAMVHASSHFDPSKDRAGVHSQLCGQCLSFSTIFSMGGAPSGMPVLPTPALALLAMAALVSLIERAAPRAFQSRAPPRSR